MVEFTREQWLKLGGGAIAVLKKHGNDAADLMADIPKAISLAKDMVAMVNTVQEAAKPPVQPVKAVLAAPTQPTPIAPKKVSAETVIEHVKVHGMSDAERAIMDRASQVVG